jgi:hypothetical protein
LRPSVTELAAKLEEPTETPSSPKGHAILFAFLTTPLLSYYLLLSPTICNAIGFPVPIVGREEVTPEGDRIADESSIVLLTFNLLKFTCTANPLYREAVIFASFVCWVQWVW